MADNAEREVFQFESRVRTPYGNGIVLDTMRTFEFLDLVVDVYGERFIIGAEDCELLEDGELL